ILSSSCIWTSAASVPGKHFQISRDKKRGGFVGSGPSKPPFAPMRGVGEGEKLINFMKLTLSTTPFHSGLHVFYEIYITPSAIACCRRITIAVTANQFLQKHFC